MESKRIVPGGKLLAAGELVKPFLAAGIDPEIVGEIAVDWINSQAVLAESIRLRNSFDPGLAKLELSDFQQRLDDLTKPFEKIPLIAFRRGKYFSLGSAALGAVGGSACGIFTEVLGRISQAAGAGSSEHTYLLGAGVGSICFGLACGGAYDLHNMVEKSWLGLRTFYRVQKHRLTSRSLSP